MNLFLECYREFSSLDLHDLLVRIEPHMPRHFLLSTLHLQSNLQKHRCEIEEIADHMLARNFELEIWRNPEVYGQIALLAKRARLNHDLSDSLESLRLQLGMVRPGSALLNAGLYRLAHVDGSFYFVSDGGIRKFRSEVLTTVKGFPGLVFLPFEGLFSDLVDRSLYPPICEPFNRCQLEIKLARAFELLESHSSELVSDLQKVIRTIVLVPNLGDRKRWSYNLRLAYFGGIFINPFVVGPCGLVEALIHEYVHQRLWQWWAYEPPSGLPPENATIRSPVTGRMKSASVMIHAFVIYVSACDFYLNWVLRGNRVSEEEKCWAETRVELLSDAIPMLYTDLCSQLRSGTVISAILDHAMERFRLIGLEGVAS